MKNKLYQAYKNKSLDEQRVIHASASFPLGAIYAILQLVFFFITRSFFLLASSLFSMSLCLSRLFSIEGFRKDKEGKRNLYIVLSTCLLVAGRHLLWGL